MDHDLHLLGIGKKVVQGTASILGKMAEALIDNYKSRASLSLEIKRKELFLDFENKEYDHQFSLQLKKIVDEKALKFLQESEQRLPELAPSLSDRYNNHLIDFAGRQTRSFIGALGVCHEKNLNDIFYLAGEKIGNQPTSNEKLDPDWVLKFVNLAKDVSKRDLQEIWARILSEETRKAGSYSIKTLNALSAMTAEELRSFEKVAKYCWDEGLLLPTKIAYADKDGYWKGDVSDLMLEPMFEYDRLLETPIFRNLSSMENDYGIFGEYSGTPCIYGLTRGCLVVRPKTREVYKRGYTFEMRLFSLVGKELFQLIDADPMSIYFEEMEEWHPGVAFECRQELPSKEERHGWGQEFK